jgi:excinuclease ABC subunit A
VIDRLAATDDMKVRLSQSIQKAMQLGKGQTMVHLQDNDAVVSYSNTLMCADTGISYDEPSPNTFSFNSPYGACPSCKGLGTVYTINMAAVIPDPSKTIAEGGIEPLGEERDAWIYKQVETLARKHKINLKKPISEMPVSQLNIILYGKENPGEDDMGLQWNDEGPGNSTGGYFDTVFEGVIPMIKRWFNSSSSESIRSWAEGFMKMDTCPECNGARLKKESLWFKVDGKNISELSELDLDELMAWFSDIEKRMSARQQAIAKEVLKEIRDRLQFLLNVGLNYLNLHRPTRTLSGGESQRIRLATQIGSQLQGITYILDEPSIGLHQRDNHRLIDALKNLRDIGNSVLVVEHDKDIMLASDHLVDIGPRAGRHGGTIVASGNPQTFINSNSETAQYLNGTKTIAVPSERRKGNGKFIELKGVTGHNLKNVSAKFPLGKLIVVTGVSGSGKSTLINETLYPLLSNHSFKASRMEAMPFKSIKGLEHIDKVIEIDQSPIGRTPRSNPATYCGFFTEIRTLFSSVPEAKIRGYKPGRFSFNVKGGRCETCEGGGMRVIEMNFLPDVYVHCEKCNGKRYNRETLEIRYKGKSIADVLDMTVDDAVEFFQAVPWLYRKIKVLQDVGLGYITLGQSAVTLSGGEAQRVKLSTDLGKRDTGKTFYILDEPTTGLHFQDIQHLLEVLNKLVDRGNTVLVIEHNMDVIKVADHIIDLGPEGGSGGGQILFEGTPEELVKVKESHTGRFLKMEL